GQGASIEVDFGTAEADQLTPALLLARFEAEYVRLFGRTVPGGIPEIVTWRVSGQSARTQRRYTMAPGQAALSDQPVG
ncbi:hypothetical protein ACMWP9_35625, partial [Escherichia coli]